MDKATMLSIIYLVQFAIVFGVLSYQNIEFQVDYVDSLLHPKN